MAGNIARHNPPPEPPLPGLARRLLARPRTVLRVTELEGRLAPATFDVTLHSGFAGETGDTLATHSGGLSLTGGSPEWVAPCG